MAFSDFVEKEIKTPICCELKRYLDKLYELYEMEELDMKLTKEAFEKMKSRAYQYGYRQGYAKAIDDVLKLPKYKFYDTSKEFMNIRIDAISIEDILKLKEKTNDK